MATTAEEILESLKRQIRDELYRVHVGGHGDGCPQCVREDGGATWGGCPIIDEYMVERVINTCAVGIRAMEAVANASERINLGIPDAPNTTIYL